MSSGILKNDDRYKLAEDTSSVSGTTYRGGGGDDDGGSSPSMENSRDDWESEYGA